VISFILRRAAPITAARVIWLIVALLDAAMWAAFVILSKRALRFVEPVAFNLIIRVLALVILAAIGLPLALTHAWSLDLGLTWAALGYMALSATIVWLVAFNAYFFALRIGEVSVVSPITSTDPVFTAVFSFLLLGTALGAPIIAGLLITVTGVILIARWYTRDDDADEPAGAEAVLPAVPRLAPGEGRWAGLQARWRGLEVVGLSLITAATWGFCPILIQAAVESVGHASLSLLMLSQGIGAVVLAPLVLARRRPLFTRRPEPRERRTLILACVVCGVIEAVFSIAFYLLIEQVGAVLTQIAVAMAPVFTLTAGVLLLRERPGWKVIGAAVLTIAGVILASVGASG
jgi:transporter family protein